MILWSFLGESEAVEPSRLSASSIQVASAGDGEEEEKSDEPKTSRDLQHGALQELMDLVRECAALEIRGSKMNCNRLCRKQKAAGKRRSPIRSENTKTLQDQITAKVEEKKSLEIEARYEQAASHR